MVYTITMRQYVLIIHIGSIWVKPQFKEFL